MPSTPLASGRSMLAVSAVLGGGVLALFCTMLSLFGIYTAMVEHLLLGHSGGLVLLIDGAASLSIGIWAVRLGRAR